ncbi:hypothetical protein [Thermonema rossianum]|uniref:hypothetical protein n=1 Tax=Thermonema rossianum TaxID=55505 RepID=UPI0012FC6521|nr:hypothetical protein [Thermonema rossianum]
MSPKHKRAMQNVGKLLFVLLLCTLSRATFAQNYFYIGEQRYKATPSRSFSFPGKNEFLIDYDGSTPFINVSIAKRSNGGYLVLSLYCTFRFNQFSGNVFLYLSDGSVIKCYDRNMGDYVNNKIIGVYLLSPAEIERLKRHRIESIRFSVKHRFEVQSQSYIATGSANTTEDVRMLFGN